MTDRTNDFEEYDDVAWENKLDEPVEDLEEIDLDAELTDYETEP